jgi:hypothetical protein
METIAQENQFNPGSPVPERPQFLTVLCILTWIACGFMFVTTLMNVVIQPSPEQIERIREANPAAADQLEEAIEQQGHSGQIANTSITLAALLVSAFGAYGMWKLRKRGFLLYICGELLPYLGLLIVGTGSLAASASMTGMTEEAFVAMAIGIMVVFDLIFILLYASNLKHMR